MSISSDPLIDAAEAAQFRKLAPHWWEPSGPCGILHALNPARLQFILDRLAPQERRILDVGCGGGILSQSLAQRGCRVTGIDIVPELLSVARTQALQDIPAVSDPSLRMSMRGVDAREGTSSNTGMYVPECHAERGIWELDNRAGTETGPYYVESTAEAYAQNHAGLFDAVACMELLEHVPDPISLLKACATLLKPGGKLFLSTLNRHPKAYLVAIIGAEYLLKRLPKNTHHYEKFIRPAELERGLASAGLRLQELSGIRYNPFNHRAHLCKDVSVNYLAYAIKR